MEEPLGTCDGCDEELYDREEHECLVLGTIVIATKNASGVSWLQSSIPIPGPTRPACAVCGHKAHGETCEDCPPRSMCPYYSPVKP